MPHSVSVLNHATTPVETVGLFIDAHVRQKPEALPALNQLLSSANPLIAYFERK